MNELTRHRLLARVARAQRNGRLPSLASGIVRDGPAWFAGRGRVEGAAPTSDTQYRIGSVTKMLTATLVLQLRDEGRLRLHDAVDEHAPGTAFGNRTVGQLLSHTAGLRAETEGEWWERTPGVGWADLRRGAVDSSLLEDRAGSFHYSNVGFAVLGQIVVRHRGSTWWEALADRVLAPLEMRRTTLAPQPPAARGWAVHPWADLVLPEPAHDAGAMAPAGQLWSTTDDLARWASFLLGDTAGVLAADTVEEMCTPAPVWQLADDAVGYGLGVMVRRRAGRLFVGHGGSMPGFVCAVTVDRGEGTAATALSNATAGLDTELTVDLLQMVHEQEPTVVDEWRPQPPQDPGVVDILGVWYWGPSPVTLRSAPGGLLRLAPLGGRGRASRLAPAGQDRWTGMDGYYAGETMRIERDDDGTPQALVLASFVFTRRPYAPEHLVPGGVDPAGWRGAVDGDGDGE